MDLVDEQHIARLQVGQDGGEVAGALDHRAGGGAEADPELARDDLCQGGLAEARRAMQQHMVERFAPAARRLDEHREVLPACPLADELAQGLRPQARLGGVFPGAGRRDRAPPFTVGVPAHRAPLCASSRRLSRITASTPAPSPSRSAIRVTTGCASCLR